MYVRRYPGGWKNKPDTTTPWSAATGQHFEDGMVQMGDQIDDLELSVGQPGGLAVLGEDSVVPDENLPTRLSTEGLSGTFVPFTTYASLVAKVAALENLINPEEGLPTQEQIEAQRDMVVYGLERIAWLKVSHLARGDSISDGQGGQNQTTPGNTGLRWVDMFRDRMRALYQPSGVAGGGGYSAAGGAYTNGATGASVYPFGWKYSTGVAGVGVTNALGETIVKLDATGEWASAQFYGTSIEVPYTEYPADNSQLIVTIDDVPVETPIFATSQTSVKVYDGLPEGLHEIKFTHAAGTIEYRIHGGHVNNGDEDAGWHTWGAARSGAITPTHTALNPMISYVSPSLVTIYFFTNEFQTKVAVATAKTRLGNLVDLHRSLSPNAAIVLIRGYEPEYKGEGAPAAPWADYRQAAKEVAAAKGTILADLEPYFGGPGVPSAAFVGDGVHPTPAGHALIDLAVWESLQLEGITITPQPETPAVTRLSLPTAASYAYRAPTTALRTAQELDIRVEDIAFTDWVSRKIFDRTMTDGSVCSLTTQSTGVIRFTVFTTAYPSGVVYASTVPLPAASGVTDLRPHFVASTRTVTFYTSADNRETWTQLGAPVTSPYASPLFDLPTAVRLGGSSGGITGTIGGIRILGEGGTEVFYQDFNEDASAWTLVGGAALVS